MARPVTIKDETILEATRQLLLEQGFRTTTAEIAARAGVSEGSIFKRFPSKAALFRAAVEGSDFQPEWQRELAGQVGQGDVRENLVGIGLRAIAFFSEVIPFIMMAWSNPDPDGLPAAFQGPTPPPVRTIKVLTGYFEAEMRAGRLRSQDPEILARAFLGALESHAFFDILMHHTGELPLAAETYVRGLVDLLWSGIAPHPQPAPRRSARP